jgi:glycosyltransferase involved in cell wall biosynthesis
MVVEPMPKLSVIVPVYNTEKYLRECVDSILAQTFPDFELILVNDGSTDGSGAICDEYAEKDPRIQVIHQVNGGVTSARKAAMRIAAGSWISFIDSDDWISPDMFDAMLETALSSGSQIVVCDAFIEHAVRCEVAGSIADNGEYDKAAMRQKIYPTMLMDIKHRRPGIAGWLCNKLFDKNLLETVFWSIDDSYIYSEDALCSYAALLECEKMYILRTPFYHYRQHTASAVHQYNGTTRYAKALYAYYAYEGMFQNRGFDLTEQINAYISVNSVDIIRKVLLFDRQNCLPARINQARQFASDQIVQTALASGRQRFSENRSRWKMLLVQKRYITVLYILLRVRYCMLKRTE